MPLEKILSKDTCLFVCLWYIIAIKIKRTGGSWKMKAKSPGIVYLIKEKRFRKIRKGDRLEQGERYIDYLPSGIMWKGNVGYRIAS
jgi:hypothetical protein